MGKETCGFDLRKETVQSRTDKKVHSRLSLWELAFLCYLATSVIVFSPAVSPKRVSAGNSDAKGAYLGWLRNILASGSSLVLRDWVLGVPVRHKRRLHSSIAVSDCILLSGPTPRCWKDPSSCSEAAICWTQCMGQSWHGSPLHSINSLDICPMKYVVLSQRPSVMSTYNFLCWWLTGQLWNGISQSAPSEVGAITTQS